MKHLLITLLLIYLMLLILLYVFQRTLLYFPTVESVNTSYERIVVTSGELQINVLVDDLTTENPSTDHAIIYFGGNAESAWASAQQLSPVFVDHIVYYMNYPGYGGSSGKPTEDSLFNAANDLYRYVAESHAHITLVGRSLGTGVAMALASQHSVPKLVLISPYDSIASVAAGHYPIFPVRWLIKDKFDSLSRASEVKADVLVLIASDDEVVPAKHSERLLEALQQRTVAKEVNDQMPSVQSKVFPQYRHNNIDAHPEFDEVIRGFLALM